MYKCDHCERVFVWKKYLRQHIRQEHPSGGTVFSMRNNFHSERTSLTVVCDKQQQDLLGRLLLFLFLLRIIESAEGISSLEEIEKSLVSSRLVDLAVFRDEKHIVPSL